MNQNVTFLYVQPKTGFFFSLVLLFYGLGFLGECLIIVCDLVIAILLT